MKLLFLFQVVGFIALWVSSFTEFYRVLPVPWLVPDVGPVFIARFLFFLLAGQLFMVLLRPCSLCEVCGGVFVFMCHSDMIHSPWASKLGLFCCLP